MDRLQPYRPRVSRETRLLLSTALIAVVALWTLARVRFPDRPPPQNPVQPLLTQLTPRPTFADLASQIAALRARLEPVLVPGPAGVSGLRVRDDVAVVWLDPKHGEAVPDAESLLARDLASGLSLVRVESSSGSQPALWAPEAGGPRYFIASDTSPAGVGLRPVYVSSLAPADNPRWPGEEWRIPSQGDLTSGSLLFTADAAFAGLVVDDHDGRLLVPAATVLAEADRLLGQPATMHGYLGVEVQSLAAALSRATGATRGLVITWVDPRGPAADVLHAGDVIEAVNGEPVPTLDHWAVQIARIGVGQTLILNVRTTGQQREVAVVESAAGPTGSAMLGLTLRPVAGIGVEIVRVEPGSSGHRSGLLPGDVITRADGIDAPTTADIRRTFASKDPRAVIIAFTRGASRQVTALEK
jgi:hypothetical protein